jgi:hypothetical protein
MPGPSWLMVVHPEAREVFVWLDFILIVGWMLGVMAVLTLALAAINGFAAWLAGRLGATTTFRERLLLIGYQIAPPAMVSLLLGLGGGLFALLSPAFAIAAKITLLAIAIGWGGWLGWRILAGLGLHGARRALALAPGIVASLGVAAAWWPAVAG